MKKLNALALSALLIPALSLGSMALATDDHDQMQSTTERAEERAQRAAERMQEDEQRSDDTHGRQPIGDQHREDQRVGDMESDDRQADHMAGQEQGAGEQYLSGKPLGGFQADDLIGSDVKHRGSGETIGRVQDLVIGDDGQVVGVTVKTGGFLGLGGQIVGLGWDQLEYTQEDDDSVLYTDMEKDSLRQAPEYQTD